MSGRRKAATRKMNERGVETLMSVARVKGRMAAVMAKTVPASLRRRMPVARR